jgi:hypothetical protein
MQTGDEIKAKNPLAQFLRQNGFQLVKRGTELATVCPFHADKSPSLRVNEAKGTWFCDPCGFGGSVIDFYSRWKNVSIGEAMRQLGGGDVAPLTSTPQPAVKPVVEKVYSYRDELDREVFQVVRLNPKSFRQRHMVEGKWVWSMDGVNRVLYHLPDVISSETVWVVEGEKDADTLSSLGLVATCNVGGAGKWMEGYTEALRDKKIYICGDNDEAGKKHVETVLASLAGKVKSVCIVTVPAPHKDISDYLVSVGESQKIAAVNNLAKAGRVLSRGIDSPVFSMVELSRIYAEYIKESATFSYDIGKWVPSLGEHVRPLVPGDLATILSDTGVGKTAMLQNIAFTAAPLDVLFFEMELPDPVTFERFMQISNRFDHKTVEGLGKTGSAMNFSQSSHIHVCGMAGLTIEKLREIIVRSELKIGRFPRLIVLDYIQLMQGKGDRYERMSTIAEELKILAKNLGVIVFIASQRKRKEDSIEIGLHDAKDSGAIENSSGLVLGAWRDANDREKLKLKILKNSKGSGAGTVHDCQFNFKTLRITQL